MTPPRAGAPEERARVTIDAALEAAGWVVQDRDLMNLAAGKGVAVREFKLARGHGYADYLLFVDGKAVGVLEAKPEGHTLRGVEPQAAKYADGLPATLRPPVKPLPFLYLSNGAETLFTNLLDPRPKSRRVFHVHRPETIAEWLTADTLDQWVKALHGEGSGYHTAAAETRPSSLRGRISALPPLEREQAYTGLYPNQIEAITGLERSLRKDKPRALIQMATGSGKTRMAVTAIYRLIKLAGARRVLFLVDRANLGEQAETEFQSFRTPDDNRKFTELYTVQRLTANTIGASTKVAITTIQRLYSILRGEAELDPDLEEGGAQLTPGGLPASEPLSVSYNPRVPPEYFDVIFVDECHRSIYSVWGRVLEYFDAYLVGLTATPAKHTFGFFNQNLVMEYPHERAVAEGVNVQFFVYNIRTRITERGSTIEAGPDTILRVRSRSGERWHRPDEDITYQGKDLDNSVVAPDQIRLVVKTFKERLRTEIFPERKEVPKTLIFAKDDQHAEDIVEIIRDEFGESNDFCQKITYKTTGAKPATLIQEFRASYRPRIAVTVDMIATGTDIRPMEIVMFMRSVKSRVLFEQMKGRGVRVIDRDELQAVTPEAVAKTHFVVIDCVGVTDGDLPDTQPLERRPSVPLKRLLESVAAGSTDGDVLSSVAARLATLDRECNVEERRAIQALSGGPRLTEIAASIVLALDPLSSLSLPASPLLPVKSLGLHWTGIQRQGVKAQGRKERAFPFSVIPSCLFASLRLRVFALNSRFRDGIDLEARSSDPAAEPERFDREAGRTGRRGAPVPLPSPSSLPPCSFLSPSRFCPAEARSAPYYVQPRQTIALYHHGPPHLPLVSSNRQRYQGARGAGRRPEHPQARSRKLTQTDFVLRPVPVIRQQPARTGPTRV